MWFGSISPCSGEVQKINPHQEIRSEATIPKRLSKGGEHLYYSLHVLTTERCSRFQPTITGLQHLLLDFLWNGRNLLVRCFIYYKPSFSGSGRTVVDGEIIWSKCLTSPICTGG